MKRHHLFIFSLICLIFCGHSIQAQKPYSIQITLENITDTVCYLAYTYGDSHMIADTAEVKNDTFEFKGKSDLPEALYVVVGDAKNRLFDLMITNDQKFKVKADAKNINETIKIKGSEENKKFYEYIKYISKHTKLMKPLQDSLKKVTDDAVLKNNINNQLKEIDAEVVSFQHEFIKKEANTFLGKFLLGTLPVEIPPTLDSASRKVRYNYYKNHYWDHIDFSDNRMLNTPFLYNMWEQYLDKTLYPIPDSINKELDLLFSRMEESGELYNYLLGKTIYKYETSKRMGYDAVFVHLALNYFKQGKTAKYHEAVVKNIIERGETLNKILIGKVSPDIIAQDSSKNIKKLKDIKADYTLLVFWSSNCGYCKKELPKINEFYKHNKEKYNLEVYAVSSDTLATKWKAFINEKEYDWVNVLGMWSAPPFYKDVFDIYSTPVLYMLDKEKKIIGKRFGFEDVENIIKFDKRVKEKMRLNKNG